MLVPNCFTCYCLAPWAERLSEKLRIRTSPIAARRGRKGRDLILPTPPSINTRGGPEGGFGGGAWGGLGGGVGGGGDQKTPARKKKQKTKQIKKKKKIFFLAFVWGGGGGWGVFLFLGGFGGRGGGLFFWFFLVGVFFVLVVLGGVGVGFVSNTKTTPTTQQPPQTKTFGTVPAGHFFLLRPLPTLVFLAAHAARRRPRLVPVPLKDGVLTFFVTLAGINQPTSWIRSLRQAGYKSSPFISEHVRSPRKKRVVPCRTAGDFPSPLSASQPPPPILLQGVFAAHGFAS